ncbi:sulfatase [Aquimarina gracilis]|uniref:Sulfatase n=1 Tax=Aquimarina gracilis TaxID=874422 RepID=A0ABU5ZPK6_9FLAO|nr:sulfatase [Aquimarina gracilis]MEB3343879.1 sulfatase [Aquimarina gracilis]
MSEDIYQTPNILILVADDAGWEDFGCYGNPYIKTPNVDYLAQNGLKATNAHLTIAQCSPSRISILTGKYPHATGAEDLHMPMPDSLDILPKFLKKKGYYSGILKKIHLGNHGKNQFDWYHKDLNTFKDFLNTSATKPFFMWVGFTDPHRPYKMNVIEKPQSTTQVIVPPYLVDNEDTRKDLANYYNYIRRMDAQIGVYLKELKSRKLLDNTLIIFLSDNGAPFPRAKGTVYDAGIKTPLILSWPARIPSAMQTDELLSVIDLAPTLLDLVGIPQSNKFQGKPIPGLFSEAPIRGRIHVFSERNWHNSDEHIRSVRTKKYKLIKNAYINLPLGTASDIGRSLSFKSLLEAKEKDSLTHAQSRMFEVPRTEFEFYDINNDPYEVNNLINDPNFQQVIVALKAELQKWIDQTEDFSPKTRRRPDNVDRFTGEVIDKIRLPDWIEGTVTKN